MINYENTSLSWCIPGIAGVSDICGTVNKTILIPSNTAINGLNHCTVIEIIVV